MWEGLAGLFKSEAVPLAPRPDAEWVTGFITLTEAVRELEGQCADAAECNANMAAEHAEECAALRQGHAAAQLELAAEMAIRTNELIGANADLRATSKKFATQLDAAWADKFKAESLVGDAERRYKETACQLEALKADLIEKTITDTDVAEDWGNGPSMVPFQRPYTPRSDLEGGAVDLRGGGTPYQSPYASPYASPGPARYSSTPPSRRAPSPAAFEIGVDEKPEGSCCVLQ